MDGSIATAMRQNQDDLATPIHEDITRQLASLVSNKVNDAKMHPSIAWRVARLLVDQRLSRSEIDELLDTVETKRLSGELVSPGAYFVASIKRIYAREEIPWRESGWEKK